jgi:ABC-type dipeptide/oligopeptide/nickel transport system ATPase subunit
MEPLLEEDDVIREISCTEADHDTENEDNVNATITDSTDESECEYVIDAATGEVSEDTKACRRLSEIRPNSEIQPHPRLSITMPSSHVAEISQTFYWPLYAKPIEWIFHQSFTGEEKDALEEKTRLVAEHLHSLDFFQPVMPEDLKDDEEPSQEAITEATIRHIQKELQDEKEDWFSDLSGGQKSKVELVRKVFLQQTCPDLLLIDETMAPLDPSSKAHVMAKLKEFCRNSVVLVIYHTDVGREVGEAGNSVECVPSNNFFDYNIHLDKGVIQIKSTC